MSEFLPPPTSAREFQVQMAASESQMADLETFLGMIEDWNERINLVGPSALPSFWPRHAWDSAQLLHVEHSALSWADVGAGAGFPGVVLAILLKGRTDARVHLVESLAKRVGFLEQVSGRLQLPVVIHHSRAEALTPPIVEVVTARACAPLRRLFGYTQGFFRAGARGLFLKGRGVEEELTEARRSWIFEADLLPSRSDASGRIVRIERLAPRGR